MDMMKKGQTYKKRLHRIEEDLKWAIRESSGDLKLGFKYLKDGDSYIYNAETGEIYLTFPKKTKGEQA
jgi:hypothetical protein